MLPAQFSDAGGQDQFGNGKIAVAAIVGIIANRLN
jgi:hypothetical protein